MFIYWMDDKEDMGTIKIDSKDFSNSKKEIGKMDLLRENQIRLCRDVIRLSKKIIYAVHRDDFKTAKSELKNIKKLILKVGSKAYENNMVSMAWQEYVEAATYYSIVVEKKLPTKKALGVSTNEYLLGLCDLCGEVVRRAISCAGKGRIDETKMLTKFIQDMFGEFLQFDFRNSDLRRKADGMKYHLNKLEDVLYDLSIHKRS